MQMGLARSKYESRLALAARALREAAENAQRIGDEGAEDDCLAIRQEIARLLEDSCNGKKRPRRQLQLLDS